MREKDVKLTDFGIDDVPKDDVDKNVEQIKKKYRYIPESVIIQQIKEFRRNKNIYDLQSQENSLRYMNEVYKKMQIEKEDIGLGFINPGDVGNEVGDKLSVIIDDSPEARIDEYVLGDKTINRLVIPVTYKSWDEQVQKSFSLSKTNKNYLIDEFGGNTDKWKGQKIDLVLVPNSIPNSSKYYIIVKKSKSE